MKPGEQERLSNRPGIDKSNWACSLVHEDKVLSYA
jgi:hypothetical protein